jgi:hypothetical protein
MHRHEFEFGATKREHVKEVVTSLIPDFLKKIEEPMKEGWLIGDGSKIYFCDFYVGSLYCDLFVNTHAWMEQKDKDRILADAPVFKAYGERFLTENRTWMQKRKIIIGDQRL